MNRYAWLAAALAAGVVSLSFLAPVPARSQARLLYVPGEAVVARKTAPPRVDWQASAAGNARATQLDFSELPVRRLLEVERHNARPAAKATQIGLARSTAREALQPMRVVLDWVPTASGGHTARFHVRSPDAMGLRVGLLLEAFDPRAELRVGGSASADAVTLVRGAQALKQSHAREYWTPSTDGDIQTVEVHAPRGVPTASIRLQVPRISHLLANSRTGFKLLKTLASGACNVDTVCRWNELGAAYQNAVGATARMVFVKDGGSYLCTGTMINDEDPRHQLPWFYTAHHCINNQTVASTLETHWSDETYSCGGSDRSYGWRNADGATYILSDAATDGALLRLNATFGASWLAGWDKRPRAAGTGVFAIHHPSGDAKKVSQGVHLSSTANQHVVAWTRGTTEGGSSGSGLFDPGTFLLRGGLFRGTASCANTGSTSNSQNRDEYSRFDLFYPKVAQHLSPPLPPNDPPVAAFDFTVSIEHNTAYFTDKSTDHDGSVVSRQWTFGDGTVSTNEWESSHTYAAGGMYAVTLKVIDDWGKVGTVTRMVRIPTALRDATPVTLSAPAGWVGFYKITTPRFAQNLRVTLSGGTGNADLYLQRAAFPTTTSYLAASRGPTNAESILYPYAHESTFVVMVHSPQGVSGAALKVTYDGGDKPVTLTAVPSGPLREGGAIHIHFKLSATHSGGTRFRVEPAGGTAQLGVDYPPFVQDFEIWEPYREGTMSLDTIDDEVIERGAKSIVLRIVPVDGVIPAGNGLIEIPLYDDDGIRGVNDFNGDNRSDVFWRHADGNNDVWLSANATTRRASVRVSDLNWKNSGSGDMDGDGRDDVIWRHAATGAHELWLSGNYLTRKSLEAQDPTFRLLGVGRDSYGYQPNLYWYDPATRKLSYWIGGFKSQARDFSRALYAYEEILGFGRVFSTHLDSVIVRNTSTGQVCLLEGGWASVCPTGATAGADWKVAGIGDFDGDRIGDVLWRNPKTGGNTMWLGSGAEDPARRTRWVPPVSDLNWSVAAIGDYNDDGISDVLWRNGKTGANDLWYSANSATRVALAPVADVGWRVVP